MRRGEGKVLEAPPEERVVGRGGGATGGKGRVEKSFNRLGGGVGKGGVGNWSERVWGFRKHTLFTCLRFM